MCFNMLHILLVASSLVAGQESGRAAFVMQQVSRDLFDQQSFGMSNAGNFLNTGDIINVTSNVAQFGVGLNQLASDNRAVSDSRPFNLSSDIANAGNIMNIGLLLESDVSVLQDAAYGQAVADYRAESNSGNILTIEEISNSSTFEGNQISLGNDASSQTGNANAGNIVKLGRKLQKFTS
eukprot:TRINITY_DN546_c1_g1_i1.p1 TRINITY_DN546_c1_g1~~TRINITY_DN546_c1_g1_i1.p1  ORF type:complete len:180 (-),score=21.30 TRINITY_DN546_c1_g1_i1:195-734(-)